MDRCPKTYENPPVWIHVTSNCVIFLTIPSSIYTFYLIAAVTPPHTDRQYKMYLIIYQFIATWSSVLNSLVGIVHYMPAFLVVQVGLLQFNSFLLISIDLILQAAVVILALVVLLHRFSIVLYGERKKKAFKIIFANLIFFTLVPTGATAIYFQHSFDFESSKKELIKDCPHFKPLVDTYEFIYINDITVINRMLFRTVMLSVALFSAFFVGLVFCLYKFRGRTPFLSETTKRLQTRLLINLAFTLSIPCFAHGIPAVVIIPILAYNLQVALWIPTFLWSLYSFHAILNCIVFIALNDYYLIQVKRDINRLMNKFKKLAQRLHLCS